MDKTLRNFQLEVLNTFKRVKGSFALAGGTALEIYYLQHRFSLDLDFFSVAFNKHEIEKIVSAFENLPGVSLKRENEIKLSGAARAVFYTLSRKGLKRPLKVDFVENNLISRPKIIKFSGVPVYSVKDIYAQKIYAVSGTSIRQDEAGRFFSEGRKEARDAFDIYMLSKKVMPLHKFIREMPKQAQRGLLHWYNTFSRHDLKIGLIDLDIYEKGFNSQEMLIYLENEVKEFIKKIAI
ncbi:MAG: nucleotidyl transferase AbiEii/AbiGii toxin family protein [Candidatus Omnitrophica bacterium]|nr:nucleotidyl transferase AbiEii/AbiGii toxin family protein [Candidatus Omnitrophota bacterium]